MKTSNKFEPLQNLEDQNQHQENERNNIQDPINSAGQAAKRREVMIVGDSILRNTASSVRSLDPLTTTVCYLPGASVKHITENVDRLLERTGDDPVVVVHIGTNNIERDRPRSLQNKFRELGRIFKRQDQNCGIFWDTAGSLQRTIWTAGNTKSKCMAEIMVHTGRLHLS
ncbi:UNVERIFIED_CONTAM: hypothetical protein FKN15_025367 [Acipenser sinensis]